MKNKIIPLISVILFFCSSTASRIIAQSLNAGDGGGNGASVVVTNLNAMYHHGQVFLTWTNTINTENHYKVYRSSTPIMHGSQLSYAEYLGYTVQASAKDYDLSAHYKKNYYLSIDSGKSFLLPNQGLFVATTLKDGSYYYAVTTERNNREDTTISMRSNATTIPIAERVSSPYPVFQKRIQIQDKTVELYTSFYSFKTQISSPPILAAGFIASDFLVFRNKNNGNQPLAIKLHGGGDDFFKGIEKATANEMNLNFESAFPNGENGFYWGCNSNYNIYHTTVRIPSTGMNYNFFQQIYQRTIDWAIRHLAIDSNRIYLTGSSAGAGGAFSYAITYPDKIAAVQLGVPCFDIATLGDSLKVQVLLGRKGTNLPCNLGAPTYTILNGGWKLHQLRNESLPLIYAINGKKDVEVGWAEKPIYYDSVNANNAGGYYFWDGRMHNGAGGSWSDGNFTCFRYKRNVSYPAFSHCSLNENYGNGDPNMGASYGSVNGTLDWKDKITDDSDKWEITLFVHNLKSRTGVVRYPDSATVDITPRRLQLFCPQVNTKYYWSVTHRSRIIQSDSSVYDGQAITIHGINVFRDSVTFRIWTNRDQFKLTNDTESTLIKESQTAVLPKRSVSCFPNPTTGQFTLSIQLENLLTADGDLEIINSIGQVVLYRRIKVTDGFFSDQFNLQQVKAGSYFLKVVLPETEISSVIIISK